MTRWNRKPLSSVASIERSAVQADAIVSGTFYVGLENIRSGGQFIDVTPVSSGDLASTKFRFDERHLLYGKLRPYLAKISTPTFSGICSTDILPILPGPAMDRQFLRYYLRQPGMVDYANSLSTGANLPRLSPSALAGIEVPVPPISEQRRIAAILDQADALRAQRHAALAQLEALGQSIFVETFGDPLTNPFGWPDAENLGDFTDLVSGITKGRRVSAGSKMRSVPYLAVANVQDKYLNLETIKRIDALESEIERYELRFGDLLLTEGGDPDKLGRGTLWEGEILECIHQNHIFRVRVIDHRVRPLYLNWLVGSQRGKQYFLRSAKQTTGIASINMGQLKLFPMLLPPLRLQDTFIERIAAIESLKSTQRTALAELDALFASLQHRAFRGEL